MFTTQNHEANSLEKRSASSGDGIARCQTFGQMGGEEEGVGKALAV